MDFLSSCVYVVCVRWYDVSLPSRLSTVVRRLEQSTSTLYSLYPLQHAVHWTGRGERRLERRRVVSDVTGSTSVRRLARAIVAAHGGAEAVVAKGGFGATPPPGEKPAYIGA